MAGVSRPALSSTVLIGALSAVRGNGGGYVYVAEALLQFFTPRRIQPEPTQFVSTPVTAALCEKVKDLTAWSDSISESIETGAQYSAAIPLYGEDSDEAVNETGQLYHGPVVLITDALCYSATDTFAAGFQDHQIGTVLARTTTPVPAARTSGSSPPSRPTGPTVRSSRCPGAPGSVWPCGVRSGSGSAGAASPSRISASFPMSATR